MGRAGEGTQRLGFAANVRWAEAAIARPRAARVPQRVDRFRKHRHRGADARMVTDVMRRLPRNAPVSPGREVAPAPQAVHTGPVRDDVTFWDSTITWSWSSKRSEMVWFSRRACMLSRLSSQTSKP